MKHTTQKQRILEALDYGQSVVDRINGESMTHPPKSTNHQTVAQRVSTNIRLAHNHYNVDMRDLFKYPYSATECNPLSISAVY